MKKFLSICVCLALVLVCGLTIVGCGKDKAKVMSQADFEKAIADAKESEVVKLAGDVTLSKAVEIGKKVKIDLNGHKITEDVEYKTQNDAQHTTMFLINQNGDLTVGGNGSVETDDLIIFWLNGTTKTDAKLQIEAGEYIGDESDVVYVTGGTATITGGSYKIDTQVKYTLNLQDNNANADIVVKGGTFHNYDPSKSASENPVKNFVADGFKVETSEDGKVFTVVANA